MVEKRVKKFGQGSPPPFSGNARKKTFVFLRMASQGRRLAIKLDENLSQYNKMMKLLMIGNEVAEGAAIWQTVTETICIVESAGQFEETDQAKPTWCTVCPSIYTPILNA